MIEESGWFQVSFICPPIVPYFFSASMTFKFSLSSKKSIAVKNEVFVTGLKPPSNNETSSSPSTMRFPSNWNVGCLLSHPTCTASNFFAFGRLLIVCLFTQRMSAALFARHVPPSFFKPSANLSVLSFRCSILRFSRGDISEARSSCASKKFSKLVIWHVAIGG